MRGHGLRVFRRAAGLEIRRDPHGAKRVTTDPGLRGVTGVTVELGDTLLKPKKTASALAVVFEVDPIGGTRGLGN